jgi:hypothetical protein
MMACGALGFGTVDTFPGQCYQMQAQAATLRRIGQGGLNEEALELAGGAAGGAAEAGRREQENVSTVDIVRHPSEAEQVLRMLPGHLRSLKHLPARAGCSLS